MNELNSPSINDEISMYHVMNLFLKRWRYLLILALIGALLALVKHRYFPTYPAKGSLMIKDVKNSQLQSLLSQVAGSMGELALPSVSEDDDMATAALVLNTHKFYVSLAKKITQEYDKQKGHKDSSLAPLFSRFSKIERNPNYLDYLAGYLSSIINIGSGKAGQIYFSLKTNRKMLSVALLNYTLEQAKQTLVERELEDLKQAEQYFQSEIDAAKTRLDQIEGVTISKMQKSHILSVDVEKGESSRYMSELKKKINDTNIKITSNMRRISGLKKKLKKKRKEDGTVISKFNEGAQIRVLQDENKELRHNLSAYESTLKNFNKQKQGLLPFQHEIEKMKANYTFEYKVYESLRSSLAKIGLQKTYVKNKVEILERERITRVRSRPGLVIMILISVLASQIFGLGMIYLYELLRPEGEIRF
jgi:uncharacterized protein involved in exopolysaccharide biosynthesis